jgi:hypothetical protein
MRSGLRPAAKPVDRQTTETHETLFLLLFFNDPANDSRLTVLYHNLVFRSSGKSCFRVKKYRDSQRAVSILLRSLKTLGRGTGEGK